METIVKQKVLGMTDIAIPLEEYKKYNMTRQQAALETAVYPEEFNYLIKS